MAGNGRSLPHLFVHERGERRPYARRGGGPEHVPSSPHRADPSAHARRLLAELESVRTAAATLDEDRRKRALEDCAGTFIDVIVQPNRDLKLSSLEDARFGIEIANVIEIDDGLVRATVFVPDGKLSILESKISAFARSADDESPRNLPLVTSIEEIRLARARSFWTDSGRDFPSDPGTHVWEVWIRNAAAVDRFRTQAAALGVALSTRAFRFPERTVLMARATVAAMTASAELLDSIAELRRPPELHLEFLGLDAELEHDLAASLVARVRAPPAGSPTVTILDTGVDVGHALLHGGLAPADAHTCFGTDVRDASPGGAHGTGTAALSLWGEDLAEALASSTAVALSHSIESVKIVPSAGANEPDEFGAVTAEAIDRVEIAAPNRARVFAMAVTAETSREAEPTSWSAAIDSLAAGARGENDCARLIIVSAGNVEPEDDAARYPAANHLAAPEDPAQAWNSVAVGAYTAHTRILDPTYSRWQALAAEGGLSPASTTAITWLSLADAPIKPDVVCEGGNFGCEIDAGTPTRLDDLGVLTARARTPGSSRVLGRVHGTSPATAMAAHLAARIRAEYPSVWPETIRALLVHSCRWTPAMVESFADEPTGRARLARMLRCYGYGVPDLRRALHSAKDALTLVVESELQPFDADETGNVAPRWMNLHALPWPSDALEKLGDERVSMRVTLSYFVEPNPGKRGVGNANHLPILGRARYPSFNLRFDVKTATETPAAFEARVSKAAGPRTTESDASEWDVGALRHRGSLHSDTWRGSAVDLASKDTVIVYPTSGWWRFRKDPAVYKRMARYSLVVSIETIGVDVPTDIYTPVANVVSVQT